MSANTERLIEEAELELSLVRDEEWGGPPGWTGNILRSLVDGVRRERDIEWCAMLGYEPAGGRGNTPEFMKRELEVNEQDSWRQALEEEKP